MRDMELELSIQLSDYKVRTHGTTRVRIQWTTVIRYVQEVQRSVLYSTLLF